MRQTGIGRGPGRSVRVQILEDEPWGIRCAGAVSEIAGGRGAALTSKSFSRSLTLRFADKVNFTMVGLFPHRCVPTRALLLCSGGLGTTCALILKLRTTDWKPIRVQFGRHSYTGKWSHERKITMQSGGRASQKAPQHRINPPTHIGPTAGPSPHSGYARRTPR